MVLMISGVLAVLGLCAGSFVNALVWRVREQEKLQENQQGAQKGSKGRKGRSGSETNQNQYLHAAYRRRLSVLHGRSMCPHCHHELAAKDLVPVFSWLSLGGKCRYCHKPISLQYPLIELATAAVFIASYFWWPEAITGAQSILFSLWLLLVTGLMALLLYDFKWLLLPNRIMYPLGGLAGLYAVVSVAIANNPLVALLNVVLSVAVGGGLFYILFQLSGGKWIGGGDVKLGWLLGLIVGTPAKAFLMIFLASIGGSLISVPLLVTGRLKRTSTIPFGPLLIFGAVLTVLFGNDLLDWYRQTILQLS